jgi:hypothetical protein
MGISLRLSLERPSIPQPRMDHHCNVYKHVGILSILPLRSCRRQRLLRLVAPGQPEHGISFAILSSIDNPTRGC